MARNTLESGARHRPAARSWGRMLPAGAGSGARSRGRDARRDRSRIARSAAPALAGRVASRDPAARTRASGRLANVEHLGQAVAGVLVELHAREMVHVHRDLPDALRGGGVRRGELMARGARRALASLIERRRVRRLGSGRGSGKSPRGMLCGDSAGSRPMAAVCVWPSRSLTSAGSLGSQGGR
jgi:hypothetical protein